MFKNLTLQTRMLVAFLFMGLIVFFAAFVGWTGTQMLNTQFRVLTDNILPTVIALQKINMGQLRVQAGERLLMNARFGRNERLEALNNIEEAWKLINEGFSEYEKLPLSPGEDVLLKDFKPKWEIWKINHKKLMQIHEEFFTYNIYRPSEKLSQLTEKDPNNLVAIQRVLKASQLIDQMIEHRRVYLAPAFTESNTALQKILDLNDTAVENAQQKANIATGQTQNWVIMGMILGPITAIIFGFYFSYVLAKPLGLKIAGIVKIAENISQGDLTTPILLSHSNDEIGRLTNAFFKMTRNLNALVSQVSQAGIKMTSSSSQLASASKQLEATVTEQVASTSEITVTAKQIAATSEDLAQTMEQVSELSNTTATKASNSQQDLRRMESSIRQLAEATTSISMKLGMISEKANIINSVVITITKVADQTNLLSLNAAIEAEKAGEYGAGFAVVAREIRRLADQTAVATLEIENMVKQMQTAVSTGVMEMDKFTQQVNQGVEDVRQISVQMGEIMQQVQYLTPRFEAVSQGTEAQAQGAQQICLAMEQLKDTSQQTVDSVRDTNFVIEQLNEAANKLKQEIARFKVSV